MGYYVSIELCEAVIPADQVNDALGAINDLFGEGHPASPESGYSWVTPPAGSDGYGFLATAIKAWRYDTSVREDGAVVIESFRGEKWGDDELLYGALAPYLAEGAEIYVTGDDGEEWGYRKEGGQLIDGRVKREWEWGV